METDNKIYCCDRDHHASGHCDGVNMKPAGMPGSMPAGY